MIMSNQQATGDELVTKYRDAATRTASVAGVEIAFRDLGRRTGIPVSIFSDSPSGA